MIGSFDVYKKNDSLFVRQIQEMEKVVRGQGRCCWLVATQKCPRGEVTTDWIATHNRTVLAYADKSDYATNGVKIEIFTSNHVRLCPSLLEEIYQYAGLETSDLADHVNGENLRRDTLNLLRRIANDALANYNQQLSDDGIGLHEIDLIENPKKDEKSLDS